MMVLLTYDGISHQRVATMQGEDFMRSKWMLPVAPIQILCRALKTNTDGRTNLFGQPREFAPTWAFLQGEGKPFRQPKSAIAQRKACIAYKSKNTSKFLVSDDTSQLVIGSQ